jgi:hypothetical protein
LGGFVVSGPASISEITNRFGAGEYRIAAYGLEACGLWGVGRRIVEGSSTAVGATCGEELMSKLSVDIQQLGRGAARSCRAWGMEQPTARAVNLARGRDHVRFGGG